MNASTLLSKYSIKNVRFLDRTLNAFVDTPAIVLDITNDDPLRMGLPEGGEAFMTRSMIGLGGYIQRFHVDAGAGTPPQRISGHFVYGPDDALWAAGRVRYEHLCTTVIDARHEDRTPSAYDYLRDATSASPHKPQEVRAGQQPEEIAAEEVVPDLQMPKITRFALRHAELDATLFVEALPGYGYVGSEDDEIMPVSIGVRPSGGREICHRFWGRLDIEIDDAAASIYVNATLVRIPDGKGDAYHLRNLEFATRCARGKLAVGTEKTIWGGQVVGLLPRNISFQLALFEDSRRNKHALTTPTA